MRRHAGLKLGCASQTSSKGSGSLWHLWLNRIAAWCQVWEGKSNISNNFGAFVRARFFTVAVIMPTGGQSRRVSPSSHGSSIPFPIILRRTNGCSSSGRYLKASAGTFIPSATEHRSCLQIDSSPQRDRRDNEFPYFLKADGNHSAQTWEPNYDKSCFNRRNSRMSGLLAVTKQFVIWTIPWLWTSSNSSRIPLVFTSRTRNPCNNFRIALSSRCVID